ncbi:MAG: trypsin-like peptidase domain-containing protein [Deltaproteobacteria bacterium]|nr:trypsin-like peptidase domain-containing protein [Deltaproteobacteria bacterium]
MQRFLLPLLLVAPIIGLLHTPLAAQMRVGEIAEVTIETPHPSPQGAAGRSVVWSHTLHHPGATFLKLHFAVLDAQEVVLKDGAGRVREVLQGRTEAEPWSRSVSGDTVIIELHADANENGFGFSIDRYGYGTVPLFPHAEHSELPDLSQLPPRSVCGTNDATGICAALVSERIRLSDPVGRVLFAGDCGGMFACTGFLFSPDSKFMTNAHCANSPRESRSMEVWFNYLGDGKDGAAASECELPNRPNPDVFRAQRFLRKHCGLDFAVHLLGDAATGNPADLYGYLPLSDRLPSAAEPLWVPQHPHGQGKAIAEENALVSTPLLEGVRFCNDRQRCRFAIGQPTGVTSEFGYTADTEPGSSGSPVLDANNQVIGLHHAGGCSAVGGENQGVLMAAILPTLAGGLETRFTTTPVRRNGRAPFLVTFDGATSVDSAGSEIREYRWDFGDGSPQVTGPDVTVSHLYVTKGTYRVFLWVTNEKGQTSTKPATKQVIVQKE